MKRIKLFIAAFALLLGVGGLVPAVAIASPQSVVCSTLGSNSSCSSTPKDSVSLTNVVHAIVNVLSIVVGVAAVIMIMVGGFRYVTSDGDSNKVSGAKSTVIYAIIGLVVVALAQGIVRFVLGKVK